jgi:hypothetical protein
MFKKMLCAGLLLVPAFVSAGLWDMLLQDGEISTRIAQLSEEDKEKLQAFCNMRDVWQQHSTEDILARAGEHSEGVALFQHVVDAAEVHVVCDVNWVKNRSHHEEAPEAHAEHHEAEHEVSA